MEEMVEKIELLLEENNEKQLREYLNNLNISDVEALIGELPDQGPRFIEILSVNRAVNVFRILDFPVQERMLKKLSGAKVAQLILSLIHISEPTRQAEISYAVFCLKKKK